MLGTCTAFFLIFVAGSDRLAEIKLSTMESLGKEIRKQRRRLGLTLDELSGRTGISKPYLSLIETGRVPNPPSDEKLQQLEQTLGFGFGELMTPAHLQRTPRDVRAILRQLLGNGQPADQEAKDAAADGAVEADTSHLCQALKELAGKMGVPFQKLMSNAVPIVNRIAGQYPRDFTDLAYPQRVAEQFISCPDISDQDAFAARVQGEAMSPKYRAGDIVVFSPAAAARNGDDCFVRFGDGQSTFQRIFFDTQASTKTPVVRLQPRNEKYPPTFVSSQQIAGLHRAVYCYHRVDED